MKIRELFKIGGIRESKKAEDYLDRDNCFIKDITDEKDHLILHLQREFDGQEGRVSLKAREEFKIISEQILKMKRIFAGKIIGLTLNQLDNFETNLKITSIGGKLQVSKITPNFLI